MSKCNYKSWIEAWRKRKRYDYVVVASKCVNLKKYLTMASSLTIASSLSLFHYKISLTSLHLTSLHLTSIYWPLKHRVELLVNPKLELNGSECASDEAGFTGAWGLQTRPRLHAHVSQLRPAQAQARPRDDPAHPPRHQLRRHFSRHLRRLRSPHQRNSYWKGIISLCLTSEFNRLYSLIEV